MGITKRFNGTQLEQELTKPCPLMPDGEWVAIEYQFAQTADKKFVKVHDIKGVVCDDNNLTVEGTFIDVDTLDQWVEVDTTSNAAWRLSVRSGWKYLECRMSVVPSTTAKWASNINIQNTYGWEISPAGKQSYLIHGDQRAYVQNTNTTTSTTEKELICTVRVYCYVAKILDDEKYI